MAQTIFCDEPGCMLPADLLLTFTDGSAVEGWCGLHYGMRIMGQVEAMQQMAAEDSDVPGVDPETETVGEPEAEPEPEEVPAEAPTEPETPADEPSEPVEAPTEKPTAVRVPRGSRATEPAGV